VGKAWKAGNGGLRPGMPHETGNAQNAENWSQHRSERAFFFPEFSAIPAFPAF